MNEFVEKCKQIINDFQNLRFDSAIREIKKWKRDPDKTKNIFKLFLHVSVCANRFIGENISKELEIYELANSTCLLLTHVVDKEKFFSGMYYTCLYILKKNLPSEACSLATFLLPGKLLDQSDPYASNKYEQLALLWKSEILKNIDKLASKKEDATNQLLILIEFLFKKLTKLCSNPYSTYTSNLKDIFQKLSNLPLDYTFQIVQYLFKDLSNTISNQQNTIFKDIDAYDYIVSLISSIFLNKLALEHKTVLIKFKDITSLFDICKESIALRKNYEFYKFFVNYSKDLLENKYLLSSSYITKHYDYLDNLIKKYGNNDDNAISTMMALLNSFEMISSIGEAKIVTQDRTFSDKEALLIMLKFCKTAEGIVKNKLSMCNKCTESCGSKYCTYDASLISMKCVKMVSKLSENEMSKDLILIAKELLLNSYKSCQELEQLRCQNWKILWNFCGRNIFNIGLVIENKFGSEIQDLYEILLAKVVKVDGLNSKSSGIGLDNPVSSVLHRNCNAMYSQGKYRKAMCYAAYSMLLATDESRKSKCCTMWLNCRQNLITKGDDNIQDLTILDVLKADSRIVEKYGIKLNLNDYDLKEICLTQMKFTYNSKSSLVSNYKKVLKSLEEMKNHLVPYAKGVLLLCFHALQFTERELIYAVISKAIKKLKEHKSKTPTEHCILINLKFYLILEKMFLRCQKINEQITAAKFTLKDFQMNHENLYDPEALDEIVPTYGGINIQEDYKCVKELQTILDEWQAQITKNIKEVITGWGFNFTLESVIFCAEYLRLYKFNYCEEKAWELAHKLASAVDDRRTCTYVTARSISNRLINDKWINEAQKFIESITSNNVVSDNEISCLFLLSLADFYCDCQMFDEARNLLEKVAKYPQIKILCNTKIYLYYADIRLRNFHSLNYTSHKEYCHLLAEIHYSMINLRDIITQKFWKISDYKYKLFSYELIFETMCNTVIPMNSLISYRDIAAHLLYGVTLAQQLGMTLRISQILRYLCFIEISRQQVKQSEVYIQDLEHILCLDNFQASRNAENIKKTSSVSRNCAPINLSENCASPELRRNRFKKPNFVTHSEYCQCYNCTNLSYQYQAFACTFMRGQLYALLNCTKEAEEFFYGAAIINSRIEEKDNEEIRQFKQFQWKSNRNFIVDYVLYLLDLGIFIYNLYPKKLLESFALIDAAIEICNDNDLDKHCVALFAKEIHLQNEIEEYFKEKFPFAVPNISEIPIDITVNNSSSCITPKVSIVQKTNNIRIGRGAKNLPTITIDEISPVSASKVTEIGNENKSSSSPEKKELPVRRSARNARRRILEDVEENTVDNEPEPVQRARRTARVSKRVSQN